MTWLQWLIWGMMVWVWLDSMQSLFGPKDRDDATSHPSHRSRTGSEEWAEDNHAPLFSRSFGSESSSWARMDPLGMEPASIPSLCPAVNVDGTPMASCSVDINGNPYGVSSQTSDHGIHGWLDDTWDHHASHSCGSDWDHSWSCGSDNHW